MKSNKSVLPTQIPIESNDLSADQVAVFMSEIAKIKTFVNTLRTREITENDITYLRFRLASLNEDMLRIVGGNKPLPGQES